MTPRPTVAAGLAAGALLATSALAQTDRDVMLEGGLTGLSVRHCATQELVTGGLAAGRASRAIVSRYTVRGAKGTASFVAEPQEGLGTPAVSSRTTRPTRSVTAPR